MEAIPQRIFVLAMISRPISTMFCDMLGKPSAWQMSAPNCLPMPMTIILRMPLWMGPRMSVWGLMRPMGMIQSASAA